MIRYYLIPFETDKEKLTCDAQPMYLDKLGLASGLIPKSLKMEGSVVTEWLREYYVVRIERKNSSEYKDIELLPLTIRLDADTELTKLTELGMNTSLVASRDDMDKVVTKWLIDDEKILSEVLK